MQCMHTKIWHESMDEQRRANLDAIRQWSEGQEDTTSASVFSEMEEARREFNSLRSTPYDFRPPTLLAFHSSSDSQCVLAVAKMTDLRPQFSGTVRPFCW